jgi:protein-S-isoprenylcysteine O-methyltransferase Ste14
MTSALAQPAAESVGRWRHVRAIGLLPFMNTVAMPSLLIALSPSSLPLRVGASTIASTAAAALLMGLGVALTAHSILLFVRHGRGTLAPWDPTRELVGVGAYRYSRNPMKAGLFLILAGEALLFRSPALAWWLVAFVAVNVVYIRLHEEPGLRARFGERYRDYCARVPRWWPSLESLYRKHGATR